MKFDVAHQSTSATVGTTSAVIVAANASRGEVTIVNDHASNVVYLALQTKVGTDPTAVSGSGVRLNSAGGSYTTDQFTGSIAAVATGAATNVTVAEI